MGLTNSDNFSEEQNKIAKYGRVLSSPARVAILDILIRREECICGDLVDELPLSQSTISQHLRELKESGLIKGEISGPKTCYCIHPQGWNEMIRCYGDLFSKFTLKNRIGC